MLLDGNHYIFSCSKKYSTKNNIFDDWTCYSDVDVKMQEAHYPESIYLATRNEFVSHWLLMLIVKVGRSKEG